MTNKLPKPTGYRLLIKPREVSNTTRGGIILTDWVLTGKYVGLKFKYEGEDYSIINDDEVIALVPDPDKISAK
jgi:co-chaperonin GroES (HSP10)